MIHATPAAVHDKGMARILVGIHATVQNRTTGSELLLNHCGPLVGRKIVTVEEHSIIVVAKRLHAFQLIVAVSAAGTGAVAHVTSLAAIAHKHRHGILLLGSGVGRIHVKHIVPIKCATR